MASGERHYISRVAADKKAIGREVEAIQAEQKWQRRGRLWKGHTLVSNSLPLSKIHHAAFDAHLIGVDPDYRIQVSDCVLEIHDGPFLELGRKGIAGQVIQLPRRIEDRPDRDRLALRFEQFKDMT